MEFARVGAGSWVIPMGVELLSYYQMINPAQVKPQRSTDGKVAATSRVAARAHA
jgi:hypothetical protein